MSGTTELAPARDRAYLTGFIAELLVDGELDVARIHEHVRRMERQIDRDAQVAVEGGRRHAA